MNIAVTYFSKTGNTKKVAEAIAQGAGCTATDIYSLKPGVPFDLLIIGGSIYGGALEPSLVKFFEALDSKSVKKAALFSTYIKEPKAIGLMSELLKGKGIPVADTFSCKGKFMLFNRKNPNETDLEAAKKFGALVIGPLAFTPKNMHS